MLRLILVIIFISGCSTARGNADFKCIATCKECIDITLECMIAIKKREVDIGS